MDNICNQCEKKFNIFVKARKKNGYTQIYYMCPHCNLIYHCYYESELSLSIQTQITELNNLLLNSQVLGQGLDFKYNFNKRQEYLQKIKLLKEKKKKELLKVN